MGGAIGERKSSEQRLHFEDLGAQIRTQVTRVSEHGLTVEQALPFLRLHGRVHDEAMRPAQIRSVSMVVYDGMPRLVLDLAYEADATQGAVAALEPKTARSSAPVDPARDARPAPEARASHAGVARPRRRDETLSYEIPAVDAVAGAMSADAAALALTVPGEVPGEDRTRLFRTLPPSQMTLEEQMLRSGQWSFRAHRYWEQELQPALEGASVFLRLWAKRTHVVVRPWLSRVAPLAIAAAATGKTLAVHLLERVRGSAQAWRARRTQRLAAAAVVAATPETVPETALPPSDLAPEAILPAAAES